MNTQPSSPRALLANKKLLLIAGALLVVIVIGIGLLSSGGGDNIQTSLERLSLRYDNLVRLTGTGNSGNISNAALAKADVEANILFVSDDTAFSNLVKSRYQTIPDNIKQSEIDTTSTNLLQNAQQLNTYDSTFLSLLQTRLTNVLALVDDTQTRSTNAETLKILKTAQTNIKAIQIRLNAVSL